MKITKDELYHILSNAVAIEVNGLFEFIDTVEKEYVRTFYMKNEYPNYGTYTFDNLLLNENVNIYELKRVELNESEDE